MVGGDRLPRDRDSGVPTSNLLQTKILLNIVISDSNKGAKFMHADIKHYFLAMPMQRPEQMRVKQKCLPNDIPTHCNLDSKVTNDDYVCIKIKKGMPGLK